MEKWEIGRAQESGIRLSDLSTEALMSLLHEIVVHVRLDNNYDFCPVIDRAEIFILTYYKWNTDAEH